MLLSPTVTEACSYVQMVNKYAGNRCQVAVEELKCISALRHYLYIIIGYVWSNRKSVSDLTEQIATDARKILLTVYNS